MAKKQVKFVRYRRRKNKRSWKFYLKLLKIPNTKRSLRLNFTYSIPIGVDDNKVAGMYSPQIILPLNFPNIATYDGGLDNGTVNVINNTTIPGAFAPGIYNKLFGTATPLFDSYKVLMLEATYLSNGVTSGSTVPGQISQHPASNTILSYNDVDDATLFISASGQAMANYLNRGASAINTNNLSKKGITYRFKQLKQNRKFYFNTAEITNNSVPESTDNVSAGSGMPGQAFASMKILWPNVYDTDLTGLRQYFGMLYVTWYVKLKYINSGAQ